MAGCCQRPAARKGEVVGNLPKFLDSAVASLDTIGMKVCGAIEAAVEQMRMRHVLFA